jgi:hypothetical protein
MNHGSTLIWTLLYFFVMISCGPKEVVREGMQPVYSDFNDFSTLKSLPSMPFENLGKIVAKGDFIYINEQGKGIHVVNNNNPSSPIQTHFWQIYGCTEFTIVDQVLYASNGKHLLVIDISNIDQIILLNVIEDQYEIIPVELYPDNYKGWFECYDPKKGILISWQMKTIINPTCEIK